MKLSYSETPRVDYDTARSAVVEYLSARPRNKMGERIPEKAAAISYAIWPDHQMTAQGAGGAASRILHRMKLTGDADWIVRDGQWGWILGSKHERAA